MNSRIMKRQLKIWKYCSRKMTLTTVIKLIVTYESKTWEKKNKMKQLELKLLRVIFDGVRAFDGWKEESKEKLKFHTEKQR